MKKQISVVTRVIKHNPEFCRLVTIPLEAVEPWKLSGTTTVEGTINGADLGRRSLKRWDERKRLDDVQRARVAVKQGRKHGSSGFLSKLFRD